MTKIIIMSIALFIAFYLIMFIDLIIGGLKKMEKKIYSLVIGRFQCLPPHDGHLGLINTLLKEDKNVCIALRDTDTNEKNPYTFEQRHRAFMKIYSKKVAEGRIKIIKIPDIEDVVYGRKVGWGIREIRLNSKIEDISGTKIREKS